MGAGLTTGPARIVLFSGGTACRTINLALSRRGHHLTRIVPAWDSGGSSKILREAFDMMPVGDIRQALMTMAHGEGRVGEVVKVCNARLSSDLGAVELRSEFDYYVSGRHPLIQRMETEVREAILGCLGLFRDRAGTEFDLRNGSIGNFVLTGAYFASDLDITRAIKAFRRLCNIEGNVWPASPLADVELRGTLNDGRVVEQQHRVTNLNEADSATGIAGVEIYCTSAESPPTAGYAALSAIAEADVIVFGPGSFWSSIYPHLLVDGVIETLSANSEARRVFVGNILECVETRGATLGGLLARFNDKLGSKGASLTHVLSNRELFPFEKKVGKFAYLRPGNLEEICQAAGITNVVGDFEDAWTRGQHDGEAVADTITTLLS